MPLLVVVVVQVRFGTIQDLKVTKAEADLDALETALHMYKSKHGGFPLETEGLAALTGDGEPLLRVSKDPWGNSYLYHQVAGTDSYALYSPGLDDRDNGGEGDDVILGPKQYRCVDYGVNCPPTAGQISAWTALVLAVFCLGVGLTRAFAALTPAADPGQ